MTHSADHYKEFETILYFDGGHGAELQCFVVIDDRNGEVVEFSWLDGTGPMSRWDTHTVTKCELLFDVLMTGLDRERLAGWLAEEEAA